MTVCYNPRCITHPWQASLNKKGKRINLGFFATQEEAEHACEVFKAEGSFPNLSQPIPSDYKIESGKGPINLKFGTDWKRNETK